MITRIGGAPEQYDTYYSFDIIDYGCDCSDVSRFALIGWKYYITSHSLRFFYIADGTSVDELRVWADLHGIEASKDVVKKTASAMEPYELYQLLEFQYIMKTRPPSMSKVNARS